MLLAGRLRLPRLSPRGTLLVRASIGAALVAGTLLALDPGRVAEELRKTYWPLAAIAVAGLCGLQVLGAAIWRFSLHHLSGIRIEWAQATRVYYAALAAGSVTPSNLGADAYRIYALSSAHPWGPLVAPIAFQRLASYVAIIVLGATASIFLPLSLSPGLMIIVLAVLASVCAAALLAVIGRGAFVRLPGMAWLQSRVPHGLSRPRAGSDRLIAGGLALSFLFHGGAIGLGYLLVVALQANPDPLPAIAVLAVARLAILVPFTAHGLGVQEGAMAILFPLAGMPAELGLAVSFLSRLGLLLTVSIGAAFLLIGTAERRRVTRPATGTPESLADAHGSYPDNVGST